MRLDIIQSRLKTYNTKTVEDEEDALKEILQEIILYGLSCTNFFNFAAFQGGTSLRILHQLPRFSEDLDFILKKPDPNFNWDLYADKIIETCQEFGIEPEISDKSKVSTAVQKIFLKDNSIGKLINLNFKHHFQKKLKIKLEIDVNPPAGSDYTRHYVTFPLDYGLLSQDLESNFSGKCHALLCRDYVKGRDWYDFNWYLKKKIKPNLVFLGNALDQHGPWESQKIKITQQWLKDIFTQKIEEINWPQAALDVKPFLGALEKESLKLWSTDFFLSRLQDFTGF